MSMDMPDKIRHLHAVPDTSPEQTPEGDANYADWMDNLPGPLALGIRRAGIVDPEEAKAWVRENQMQRVHKIGELSVVEPEASNE